jgi:hypothetical protein
MSLSRREAVGPEVRRVTVWQEMSEGEGQMAFGPRDPFTAGATVTEAAMRENSPAGSAPRRPPAASATGRLIVEYHTAFLQASEAQEGNEKDHFPQSGEMARSIKILLRPDSPTGPSFSTARRQRSEDLSHLRKTLNPGIPGLPLNIFRRFRAMACLPRGRLAYRGSIQLKATRPFARSSSPTYTFPRRREPRQPKTAQSRRFFAGKLSTGRGIAGWRQPLAKIGDLGFTRGGTAGSAGRPRRCCARIAQQTDWRGSESAQAVRRVGALSAIRLSKNGPGESNVRGLE